MSLCTCVMRCVCVRQWVGPRWPPPPWWRGVAPGPPLIVRLCESIIFMKSTHPKVGMALIGVWVEAKVWALARRDAHSFLAVWAVCCIVNCIVTGGGLKRV